MMTHLDRSPMRLGMGRSGGVSARQGLLLLAAVGIVIVALGLEIGLEGRDAFWLDESWTGAIVGQPNWTDALHQIYWDVNAPLYYVVMRVWSGLFGPSDAALRAPSLICAALTPLVAALLPSPGLTRGQRLGWAAMLAFWFPAMCFAQEARGYALLLLVATLQTLAFLRLMADPGLRRAFSWASLAAVAILVHYDAIYLSAAQGLIYLGRHRLRAVRTWTAALPFVPAFGWLAFHWPRIVQFTRPDVAWYAPLRVAELPGIARYLADGGKPMLGWLLALGLAGLSLRLLPLPAAAPAPGRRGPLFLTVSASGLAAAALVGAGFLRPSFTFRYLTPSEPGLLLALILVASALCGRRARPIACAALAVLYLTISGWMLAHHLRMAPRRYNFEAASQALMRSRPTRLVFLWDHPVDPILRREQLASLGGFFLHRSGMPTVVTPVVLARGEDPNLRLVQAAQRPGSAILWLYDTVVHGTAAITHPPEIVRLDPAFVCRQFAGGRFGVLACVRRTAISVQAGGAYQRGGATQRQGSTSPHPKGGGGGP